MNKVNDPDTVRFLNILDSLGLKQYVKCPTHESENTLDLIITEDNFMYDLIEPEDIFYISDHSFVRSSIKINCDPIPKKTVSYRKLKSIDEDALESDLKSFVENSESIQDLDSLVKYYHDGLTQILDKHAPIITKLFAPKPKKLWFDDVCKSLKRDKRKLERKWRKSKLQIDYDNYKIARNIYVKHLYAMKVKHYKKAIEDCGDNTKKLYNTVFGLLNRSTEIEMPNDAEIECADKFADFFINKIRSIREPLDQFPLFESTSHFNGLHLTNIEPVSEELVSKVLANSKPTTSLIDPFPSCLIKGHRSVLIPIITKLINF